MALKGDSQARLGGHLEGGQCAGFLGQYVVKAAHSERKEQGLPLKRQFFLFLFLFFFFFFFLEKAWNQGFASCAVYPGGGVPAFFGILGV